MAISDPGLLELMDSPTLSAAKSVKEFAVLNSKLYALLTLTIDEMLIAAYGTDVLNGFDLWDNLRTVFKPSGSEITAAERQLASLRLSTGGRVEPHIALFQQFLAKIDPQGTRFSLNERVSKLFDSLPASYQSLRNSIHHSGELSFEEVSKRVVHLSSVLRAAPAAPGHTAAFASDNVLADRDSLSSDTSARDPGLARDRSNITCQFCGGKRHTARDCFTLLGLLKSASQDQLHVALNEHVYNASLRQDLANRINRFQPRKRASFASHQPHPVVPRFAVSAQAIAMLAQPNQSGALIDSGCTMHMTSDPSLLSSVVPSVHEISTAKEGSFMYSTHEGDLQCGLGRCLVVPDLGGTLLSSGRLRRDGFVYSFSFETPNGGRDTWSMTKGLLRFTASTTYDGTLYFIPFEQLRSLQSVSAVSVDAGSGSSLCSSPHVDAACRVQPPATLSSSSPHANEARKVQPPVSSSSPSSPIVSKDITLWHHRLGHLNMRSVGSLREFLSFPTSASSSISSPCHGCALGKLRRLPFDSASHVRAGKPLERLYLDLKGPVNTVSLQGNRYALLIVDDCTRYQWSIYLPNKAADTVRDAIDRLFQTLELRHKNTIQFIRTDRGSEFVNTDLSGLLELLQVDHSTSVPYSSASMGTVERRHQTLTNDATAMMLAAGLDKHYWQYADACATYVRNRVPMASNRNNASPHELLYGERPMLTHLRVFGCPAFAWLPKQFRSKYDARAIPTIFVGYPSDSVGYLCFDPVRRREVRSRDVIFDEAVVVHRSLAVIDQTLVPSSKNSNGPVHEFPPVTSSPDSGHIDLSIDPDDDDDDDSTGNLNDLAHALPLAASTLPVQQQQSFKPLVEEPFSEDSSPFVDPTVEVQPSSAVDSPSIDSSHILQPNSWSSGDFHLSSTSSDARRSGRIRSPPARLLDYDLSARVVVDHPAGVSSLDDKFLATYSAPAEDSCIPASVADILEPDSDNLPQSFAEAVEGPDGHLWKEAIQQEKEALLANEVYEVVPVTLDIQSSIINSRFVFRIKADADGNATVFKARIVAKGYAQQPGRDYGETFAPVVSSSSLLTLLAVAARDGLYLGQADVKTAFLYGDLEEDVYLKPPAGIPIATGHVWKLKKSLYGLKQAPLCWNRKLDSALLCQGLQPTLTDPCFYHGTISGEAVFMAVYVDDLIIAGRTKMIVDKIKRFLASQFDIKDLGRLEWCLGLKVTYRDDGSILLSQPAYARGLVREIGLDHAKPASTPADPYSRLERADIPSTSDSSGMEYASAVGKLIHLARWTRPDIAFAVMQVARFTNPSSHGPAHWSALQRICRYIAGTLDHGVVFRAGVSDSPSLSAYSDADWAGEPIHRRSTSGTIVLLNGSPVFWTSKMQKVVAHSSCEAEFVAANQSIMALWPVRELLSEIKLLDGVPCLHVDNQAAINLCKPLASRKNSKHIELKYSYARSMVYERKISLRYCPTNMMLADLFTKPLQGPVLNRLLVNFMGTSG